MRLSNASARNSLEVSAWILAAFLSASCMRGFLPAPLYDDSYQYLTAAANFEHGKGVVTPLVHFDSERTRGRIPAPVTTFPPGYPVLLAIASGPFDLEASARMLSALCYAAAMGLLAWGLILTGVSPPIRQVVLFLFAANAIALEFSTSVMTEPLYTALSTGAVVSLIWAETAARWNRVATAGAVMAYTLAGLGYWVRNAGLFLIAGLIGYALLRLALREGRERMRLLGPALISPALAGGMMTRNFLIAGTWKGGNEMPVIHPLKAVLADFARAQFHLIGGEHPFVAGVWEGLLLLGALIAAALLVAAVRRGGWSPAQPAEVLLWVLVGVYWAGMLMAGWRTVITFGVRMFVPMLPIYLLLLGMALNRLMPVPAGGVWRGVLLAGLLALVVGYAGVNARDLYRGRLQAKHESLAALYAEPGAGGRPLRDWVDSNIGPQDGILAADGQATGYLLRRPTLSMVASHYSPLRWDCAEVRREMQRFQLHYLILYKPAAHLDNEDSLLSESPFVAISATQQPLCGFVVAAENAGVRVLKIDPAAAAVGN